MVVSVVTLTWVGGLVLRYDREGLKVPSFRRADCREQVHRQRPVRSGRVDTATYERIVLVGMHRKVFSDLLAAGEDDHQAQRVDSGRAPAPSG